jgi:hypothetical protein
MLSQDAMLHKHPMLLKLKARCFRDAQKLSAFLARSGYC